MTLLALGLVVLIGLGVLVALWNFRYVYERMDELMVLSQRQHDEIQQLKAARPSAEIKS